MNYKYIDIAVGVNGYVRKDFKEIDEESNKNGILNIYRMSDDLDKEKLKIAGVEPLTLENFSTDDIVKIIGNGEVIGIGETGLDFSNPFAFRKKQINSFETHLQEAQRRNLPVIAKCINAFDDFCALMEKYPEVAKQTIVTRFDGEVRDLLRLIGLGCYVGIDDYIIEQFNNAESFMTIMLIPQDKMIPYTGSPYSRVTDINGKRRENYPWYVKQIINRLSQILAVDVDKMEEICLENTRKIFSL